RLAMLRQMEIDMRRCNESKQQYFFRQLIKGIIICISIFIIGNFLYMNSSLFFRTNNLLHRRTLLTMHLNRTDLYLKKGEESHVYVVALNKRVSFTSTNFRVAGVNFNGRIFGYQTGQAFILAKVDDRILKCRVHVLDISKKSVTIRKGKATRLHIYGSNAFVKWKSSNPKVASVNMFGRITGKNKGRATIYANVKGISFECRVLVK
ncbi:MAG: hypothetical protein H6Q59_1567, partial [Firmicutes bacterium]|nr:hypothetical protein [Bacillota bacterium]